MNLTLTRKTDPALFAELEKIPPKNRNLSWLLKNRPDLANALMKKASSGEALQDVPWYGDPTNYTPTDLIKGAITGGAKGLIKNLGAQGLSLASMEAAYNELEKKYPNHPILDALASLIVPIAGSHAASKIVERFKKNGGKIPETISPNVPKPNAASKNLEPPAEPSPSPPPFFSPDAGYSPTDKVRQLLRDGLVPEGELKRTPIKFPWENALPQDELDSLKDYIQSVNPPLPEKEPIKFPFEISANPDELLGIRQQLEGGPSPLSRPQKFPWDQANKQKTLRILQDYIRAVNPPLPETEPVRFPFEVSANPEEIQGIRQQMESGHSPPLVADSLEGGQTPTEEPQEGTSPETEPSSQTPPADISVPGLPPEEIPVSKEEVATEPPKASVKPKTKKKTVKVTSQEDDRTPQKMGLENGLPAISNLKPVGTVNAKELLNLFKDGYQEARFDPEGQRIIAIDHSHNLASIPANVKEAGIIKATPELESVLAKAGNRDVLIDAQNSKFGNLNHQYKTDSYNEIPPLSSYDVLHTFSPAEARVIQDLTKNLTSDKNHYTSRVLFHSEGDGKIHAVGTNLHVLVEKVFPAPKGEPFRATLPGARLAKMADGKSPLSILRTTFPKETYAGATGNRFTSTPPTRYIDYNDIYNQGHGLKIKIPEGLKNSLKDAISRKHSDVNLRYKNGKLTISDEVGDIDSFHIPDSPAGSFSLFYEPTHLLRALNAIQSPEIEALLPEESKSASDYPTLIRDTTNEDRGVVMPLGDEKSFVKMGEETSEGSSPQDPSSTMGFMGTQMLASPAFRKSLSLDKVRDFLKGAADTFGEHFIAPKTEAFQKYISSLGEFERVSAQMDMAVRHSIESFDKLPEKLQQKILDDYEHGRLIPNTPELQTLVKMGEFRNNLWKIVQGLSGVSSDIPNYLAHVYKNPKEAEKILEEFIKRQGGLAGALHYMKKRQISFYDVARDLGIEPLTNNPLRLQALTIRALNRYLMAHHFRQQLLDSGMAEESAIAKAKGLTDWVPVDDKVMEGLVVPKEVQKIWRQNQINESLESALAPISSISNTVNAVNLGLSAYHFMTTTLSSMSRMGGIGLSDLINSMSLKGLSPDVRRKMLASGLKDLAFLRAPFKYVKTGAAVRKRAKQLGMSVYGDVSEMTNSPTDTLLRAVALAGGRIQKPAQYRVSARSIQEAMKTFREGRHLEGVVQLVPALLEKMSEPLFEKWVPSLKIGMFGHFVESILRENPGKTLEELTPELQKAWRSVDNSEGEVVYDNLGWSKTSRMLAHMSVRSVGWNWGTLSLFGHAVMDSKDFAKGVLTGKGGRFTPDMGYLPFLVLVTGLAGSTVYALQFGKFPDNEADAIMPPMGYLDENGNMVIQKNADGTIRRWIMPTYLKDAFAYNHDASQTIINKLNPLLELITEQIQNRNYYGETIASPSDPFLERIGERAESLASGALPFSITGLMQNVKHESGFGQDIGPLVGFMPGPKYMVTTPAEEYASQLAESRMPPMKKSERDIRDLHSQLEQELRTDPKKGMKSLMQALRDHKVTRETAVRMIKMSRMNPMEYHIRVLPMSDLLKVWEKAKTEEGVSAPRKAQNLQDIRKTLLRRVMENPSVLGNLDDKERATVLQIIRGQEYSTDKAS